MWHWLQTLLAVAQSIGARATAPPPVASRKKLRPTALSVCGASLTLLEWQKMTQVEKRLDALAGGFPERYLPVVRPWPVLSQPPAILILAVGLSCRPDFGISGWIGAETWDGAGTGRVYGAGPIVGVVADLAPRDDARLGAC